MASDQQVPDEAPNRVSMCGMEFLDCRDQTQCWKLWGGPLVSGAVQGDTLSKSTKSFFVGDFGTTMHGLHRIFEDSTGICRGLLWLGFFSFGLFMFVGLSKETITNFSNHTLSENVLHKAYGSLPFPAVTICNTNPVSCNCDLFYDAELIEKVPHVLQYQCSPFWEYYLLCGDSAIGALENRTCIMDIWRANFARNATDVDTMRQALFPFPTKPHCTMDEGLKTRLLQDADRALKGGHSFYDCWLNHNSSEGCRPHVSFKELYNYAGFPFSIIVSEASFTGGHPNGTVGKFNITASKFWTTAAQPLLGLCHTFNGKDKAAQPYRATQYNQPALEILFNENSLESVQLSSAMDRS